MDIIRELENEQLKSEVTPFNVGDTIRVYAKGYKRKTADVRRRCYQKTGRRHQRNFHSKTYRFRRWR